MGLFRKNGAIAMQPDDTYCVMAYCHDENFIMTGGLSEADAEKALEKIVGEIEEGKKIIKSIYRKFVVIYGIEHFAVKNVDDVMEWEDAEDEEDERR